MVHAFPDYTRGMSIDVTVEDPEFPTKFAGRPTSEIRERGTGTTVTGSMTTIVEKVITAEKYFHLSKILVTWSGTDEQHIKVSLDTEVVAEYYATAYVIDWFATGVKMLGDDEKTVKIEAQATETGADLIGFINGEEV